jgi:Membrane-bound metallopeptidase
MKQWLNIFLICLLSIGICAQNSKRLSDLQKKRKDALEQVENTAKMLKKNQVTTKNTIYRLNLLGDQIKVHEGQLSKINKEMAVIDSEVTDVKAEYDELNKQLDIKKERYAKSLRLLAKRNKFEDKLMFILSAKNLNQFTRRMRYLDEYASFQRVQANEISRKQAELNEKRIVLESVYHKKEKIKDIQVKENVILEHERNVQSDLVAELKGQQRALNAELKKQKRQADQLNRQIENLIAAEARKAAQKAEKDKTRKRTPEIKGGYAMTVEEKHLSGDFGKNCGALPFPVSKPGTIVVHFGEQKYQDLKYVQNNSKGIDIKTQPGASALAVFGGIVSKVFALPGFNNSIIIRHGNYLSVYANLSDIYVKAGDKVSLSQPIGKIFVDSGQGNITVMHFQLWKDTQRLNPELWLRKR